MRMKYHQNALAARAPVAGGARGFAQRVAAGSARRASAAISRAPRRVGRDHDQAERDHGHARSPMITP